MKSILSVEDLRITYDIIDAVKGVSLDVFEGEIITLIGANGAGKSSILKAISGVVKSSGRIRLHGADISGKSPEEIVKMGLSHVPEGRGIFGNLTVKENLLIGAWHRKDDRSVKADIQRMFDFFPRLRERQQQSGGTLSGGEQQMLAIARSLMSNPSLVLLDEPSMGLSPRLAEETFAILSDIHKQGVTIVLVEQNAHLALQFADRAYVLETGSIILTDHAKKLLEDPRIQHAYLGA